MRVLWFTNSPSCYKASSIKHGYNGGGWISSLQCSIQNDNEVQLGIAFFMTGEPKKTTENGVTYYPIDNNGIDSKIKSLIPGYYKRYEIETWATYEKMFEDVVKDFQPDIIHVFGSEEQFGLVARITKIPVVLHVQGLIIPYINAFYPPSVSRAKYLFQDFNPLYFLKRLRHLHLWKLAGIREKEILGNIKYYLGRTKWDERLIHIFNPNSIYYTGGEILRSVFYEDGNRVIPSKVTIVTTISSPMYKGYDVILKAAKILKEQLHVDFEWNAFGDIDPSFIEKCINIYHEDVNVALRGVASAEQLKEAMLRSTVYVHSSYIDNSPNSVCEAQILGVTPIVTGVGGVASLVEDSKTGFVVPSNDPYQIAYLIDKISSDPELNYHIGDNAKNVAKDRHDRTKIVDALLNTYKLIIDE